MDGSNLTIEQMLMLIGKQTYAIEALQIQLRNSAAHADTLGAENTRLMEENTSLKLQITETTRAAQQTESPFPFKEGSVAPQQEPPFPLPEGGCCNAQQENA